jgi:hypothetical protein
LQLRTGEKNKLAHPMELRTEEKNKQGGAPAAVARRADEQTRWHNPNSCGKGRKQTSWRMRDPCMGVCCAAKG